MWAEQQRRHPHRHEEGQDNSRSIKTTFFVLHTLSLLVGVGLFLIASHAQQVEKSTMGSIKLYVTLATATICFIAGAGLFLSVIVGFLALFFKKPFLWLLYCILLSLIGLSLFAAAGTSAGNISAHQVVSQSLKDLMIEYGNVNKKESVEMTTAWDRLQQKYRCCGVGNYTDWQSVEFGLTSLRVPPSCCLKERWKSRFKHFPKNCGQNMLPDHKKAAEFIFVNGCLKVIMKEMDLQLFIMGTFGVITAFFTLIVVIFACFLVITKRI